MAFNLFADTFPVEASGVHASDNQDDDHCTHQNWRPRIAHRIVILIDFDVHLRTAPLSHDS